MEPLDAAALTALLDAAKAGSATIGNGPGELPSVAAEVLAVLGFQAASESQWTCSMVTANAAWRPMQRACTGWPAALYASGRRGAAHQLHQARQEGLSVADPLQLEGRAG